MIDEFVIEGIRNRYSNLHPMIFHRTVEKASSPGELFDILEEFPKKYPIIWSDEERRWITTKDLTQSGKFDLGR